MYAEQVFKPIRSVYIASDKQTCHTKTSHLLQSHRKSTSGEATAETPALRSASPRLQHFLTVPKSL